MSARGNFKVFIDEYEIEGKNSSKSFYNGKGSTSGNNLKSKKETNSQQVW